MNYQITTTVNITFPTLYVNVINKDMVISGGVNLKIPSEKNILEKMG